MRIPLTPLLLTFLLLPLAAGAAIDESQFRTDLAAIASSSTRVIGSDGYRHAARYLEEQIRALDHVELRRHEYPMIAPVTRSATLTLWDGTIEPIYPFWPAGARVNSTPRDGISGKLVYCGGATPAEIPPRSLHGQIAVIEASAGERWQRVAYFGARAIIVLGSRDTTHVELRSHDLAIPLNIPRFYVPPGPLSERLRAGSLSEIATIRATVAWERTEAVNLYALVRARTSAAMTGAAALVIAVPFDSSGLVPDLARGAGQAANTAAGLALLRDLARHPLHRPVVVAFLGGDSINFLGSRNMLLALAESPSRWEAELSEISNFKSEIENELARAAEIRGAPDQLDPSRDRKLLARINQLIEADAVAEQDRLFQLRTMQRSPTEQGEQDALESRQIALARLRYEFARHPSRLASAEARHYLARTIERLTALRDQHESRQRELRERQSLYRWLAVAVGRDANPRKDQNDQRPIELLVALDLSDRGSRCGPMFFGAYQRVPNVTDIQDYRDWFARALRAGTPWLTALLDVIDFEPLAQSRAPASFLAGPLPIGTEMAPAWGVPAFSIVTLDDLRLRRDTPTDTLDNLDVDLILRQLIAVRELVVNAWNDPTFKGPVERKRQRIDITGQVVAAAPGRPVPDLPRQGFLATCIHTASLPRKIPQIRAMPWTLGIRRCEMRDTDADGRYRFEGIPRIVPDPAKDSYLAVQMFRVDANSGAITAATDLGRQAVDMNMYVDLRIDPQPLRSLAFTCEEFALAGLYDPRYLQSLNQVIPLDARRNAEPQRYNFLLLDQLMAGFVEPGARSNLIFRYGRVGNRLLLLNLPALGFTARELDDIGPLALVTSRDFWRLDEQRLSAYRAAGVSSSLVDSMHTEAAAMLDLASKNYDANLGSATERDAAGAWASEARVYAAAEDMARDVVRGAIFLLMLCVPFAFVMERLLIASAKIYRQIVWAALIFAAMAAALWAFHPAFRISSSPLIIILAFAIILMSLVVIFVIYGKFDTELKRLHWGRGTTEAASFARAGVLASAVMLGIANMRRRKFRTALTSITVVLITFAILCFTSATRYLDTTTLPAGIASSHHGVMLRLRGFRPMPSLASEEIAPVIEHAAGRPVRTVERWWNESSKDPTEMVNLVADSQRVVAVQAVLGLSPGESQLSRIGAVIGTEKFARLERGESNIVYLSDVTARQLEAREGETIRIGGIPLQIAGVFNANEFDRNVKMLSGEPLAPLEYSTNARDAGGRKLDDTSAETIELDGGADGGSSELGGAYRHLSSTHFVIVPASVSRMLENASLRGVAVGLNDDAEVKKVSDALAKRYSLVLFAGFDDGVRMATASNLTAVSGAGQVAIPLAIAGLIVFNTMMGSIAERRREIHTYTSLGLAPVHVGALFLAEALVYGLVGGVFGYIIGQAAGTLLLKLGWLGDVTLNYSGTSAMLTIAMILLIVAISAIIPARLASRLAAPSIERTWNVPQPMDGVIRAPLPFTINRTAADGAIAYLAEFFAAHQEGSLGKFAAGQVRTIANEAARGLTTDIWLAPFDLGVRQRLELRIHPGAFADIYEVEVILTRESGDDASWYRMNRPFLTELRKQFLQWRSLTPARMQEYARMNPTG